MPFFELPPEWELPVNIVFLAATFAIAWHGIRYRDKEGNTDFVRQLFGCIAAVYFLMVMLEDVLGLVDF